MGNLAELAPWHRCTDGWQWRCCCPLMLGCVGEKLAANQLVLFDQ